jgi:hypothetical protein
MQSNETRVTVQINIKTRSIVSWCTNHDNLLTDVKTTLEFQYLQSSVSKDN